MLINFPQVDFWSIQSHSWIVSKKTANPSLYLCMQIFRPIHESPALWDFYNSLSLSANGTVIWWHFSPVINHRIWKKGEGISSYNYVSQFVDSAFITRQVIVVKLFKRARPSLEGQNPSERVSLFPSLKKEATVCSTASGTRILPTTQWAWQEPWSCPRGTWIPALGNPGKTLYSEKLWDNEGVVF